MEGLLSQLGVPSAEAEGIDVSDDESPYAAVADFRTSDGALLAAHPSASACNMVDEKAPTDNRTPVQSLVVSRRRYTGCG